MNEDSQKWGRYQKRQESQKRKEVERETFVDPGQQHCFGVLVSPWRFNTNKIILILELSIHNNISSHEYLVKLLLYSV